MKKSILKSPALALALAASTLTACEDATRTENTVLGALATGAAAKVLGASDNVTAATALAGAVGAPLINRATNAGCQLSSRPSGSLVFRSEVDGLYLICDNVGLSNQAVQDLRRNPEWTPLTASGSNSRGRSGRGGPTLRGFN